MKDLIFDVIVNYDGLELASIGATCKSKAIKIAKRKAEYANKEENVFIRVFRRSDGQTLYLNRNNGYDLTGKSWTCL